MLVKINKSPLLITSWLRVNPKELLKWIIDPMTFPCFKGSLLFVPALLTGATLWAIWIDQTSSFHIRLLIIPDVFALYYNRWSVRLWAHIIKHASAHTDMCAQLLTCSQPDRKDIFGNIISPLPWRMSANKTRKNLKSSLGKKKEQIFDLIIFSIMHFVCLTGLVDRESSG